MSSSSQPKKNVSSFSWWMWIVLDQEKALITKSCMSVGDVMLGAWSQRELRPRIKVLWTRHISVAAAEAGCSFLRLWSWGRRACQMCKLTSLKKKQELLWARQRRLHEEVITYAITSTRSLQKLVRTVCPLLGGLRGSLAHDGGHVEEKG